MTMAQLGETAIKIMGVYYGASAVFAVAAMISAFLMPQPEGFPSATELAPMHLIGVLAAAVVAVAFLWGGRTAASVIFSEEPISTNGLPRRDWLFIGISLIGLTWALSGVPALIEAIGRVIWYAEASRQPMFAEAMRQSSDEIVNAGLSVLMGAAVVVSARGLSNRLDAGS